jgi:hypothetical protein
MSMHGIAERVGGLGERARERMTEGRIEKLDRENVRLKTEIGVLRHDLEEDRTALHEALSALRERGEQSVTIDHGGRGRFVRTALLAGGSYVLGTRAGRGRYDQMKGWMRSAGETVRARMNGGEDVTSTWEPSAPDSVAGAEPPSRA